MANSLINGPQGETSAVQPQTDDARVWMYRGDEARLFASAADVPKGGGWADAPGKPASKQEKEADGDGG